MGALSGSDRQSAERNRAAGLGDADVTDTPLWRRYLRLHGPDANADVRDEIAFHLEMRAQELIAAGTPPEQAHQEALRHFGNMEQIQRECLDEDRRILKQHTRRERLGAFLQDVRYGLRMLWRSPSFAIVAVLTLGLGVGANTAIFSVVNSVLLEPLPYPNRDRSVVLWSSWKDFPQTWVSYDEIEAYGTEIPAFTEVGMFTDFYTNFAERGEPERVHVGSVSANVFRILGVQPVLGRVFLPEEDVPDRNDAVILGHGLWQRRFAGDPGVIGRTIEVAGEPVRVVGVMPAGFRLPLDFGADGPTEAWFPLAATAEDYGAIAGPAMVSNGGSHGLYGLASLAPGATAEQANQQLKALTDRLTADGIYPEVWDFRATAIPVQQQVTGKIKPALFVLLGAAGLVLLIACANIAGLLLVRGEQRRRESGLRIALGAERRRLVQQFLSESLALGLIGGIIGIAIGWLGVRLVRATAPASLPKVAEAGLDLRVLAFGLAVAIFTVLLFGLLPALQTSQVDPVAAIRDGSRGATSGKTRLRTRQALVVGEIALAVALAVGAGLMVRTVARLFAIDPGFNPDRVLTMELSVSSSHYPDSAAVVRFYDELRRRVETLPGVEAVGAARLLPLAAEMGDWGLMIEGYTPPPGEGTPGDWQVATPGYFQALGIRPVSGRVFDGRDHMNAPLVMVVNRRLAEKYFAGQDPIGRRVKIGNPDNPWVTVVGVVDDVRHNTLTDEVKPQFYAPHAQFPQSTGFAPRTMSLVVRADRDPATLVRPIREQVRALDPRLPVSNIREMNEIVANSVAQPRFTMLLLAAFGALAIFLAAVGVYGVVSQVVTARSREFGIRAALGAQPERLVWLSLRGGLWQTGIGLLLGTVTAFALTRLLAGMVYGVRTTDAATFALVLLSVAGVALVASWIPARQASRADPARVLQYD